MTTSDKQHHPKRMLGSGFTLAVIVGGTIGLGILRTPGEIAAVVPDQASNTRPANSTQQAGEKPLIHEVTNSLLFGGGNHEDTSASSF